MKIIRYRDLEIWQKGMKIVKTVYTTTQRFPHDEKYGLVNQMRRASVSIVSNIAEGFNRFSKKEFRQFLYMSLGSSAELETQIEIAKELGYLSNDVGKNILIELDHQAKMMMKLIKSIDCTNNEHASTPVH